MSFGRIVSAGTTRKELLLLFKESDTRTAASSSKNFRYLMTEASMGLSANGLKETSTLCSPPSCFCAWTDVNATETMARVNISFFMTEI